MSHAVLDPSNTLTCFRSIQFSICSGIILLATFIPKGAFALNPKAIEGVRNEQEFDGDSSIDIAKKGDVEGDRHERDESDISS